MFSHVLYSLEQDISFHLLFLSSEDVLLTLLMLFLSHSIFFHERCISFDGNCEDELQDLLGFSPLISTPQMSLPVTPYEFACTTFAIKF